MPTSPDGIAPGELQAAVRRAGRQIDHLGSRRFGRHPEIEGLGDDLHWSLVYLAGRPIPLADGPRAAAALLGYFPPTAFEAAFAAIRERFQVAAFRQAYIDTCDRIGERLFGELPQAEVLAERLEQLVGAADFSGRPLAAGWADLPRPSSTGARVERAAAVLREHRGDAHLHVIATHGLLGPEALLLKARWDGAEDPESHARFFGWRDRADLDAAWGRLEASGRVDDDRELTTAGRRERDAIEDLTDALAAQPWAELDPAVRTELLERLDAAVPV